MLLRNIYTCCSIHLFKLCVAITCVPDDIFIYIFHRKNEDGLTPMHQAASEGHVQCMKALIDAGADIDGEDARGHKPIDLAKLWGHKKCGR